MPKIAAYAANTPKLTEAMTVKQRMTGIKSEFTSSQPQLRGFIQMRSPEIRTSIFFVLRRRDPSI